MPKQGLFCDLSISTVIESDPSLKSYLVMDAMFGVVECVVGAKGAMQQQIGVCSAAAAAPKTNRFERDKTEKTSVRREQRRKK